MQKTNGDS